jgi:hypothetical protein
VLRVAATFSDRSSDQIFQRKNSETCEAGGGAIHAATMDTVQMALFSRSFIRKRAIAAATTLVVSVASLALGQAPPAHRLRPLATAQQVSARQASPETPPALQKAAKAESNAGSKAEWKPTPICDRRVHTFEATETSPPSPSPG